jgi:hypothetical protein
MRPVHPGRLLAGAASEAAQSFLEPFAEVE